MYFITGICSIIDIVFTTFSEDKIMYVSSYTDRNRNLILHNLIANRIYASQRNEYCFLKIMLSGKTGKHTYLSTYFHTMERHKGYTIKYGKYSKVIVSILSKEGEEMLQFNIRNN
jgi:hypothetical protein